MHTLYFKLWTDAPTFEKTYVWMHVDCPSIDAARIMWDVLANDQRVTVLQVRP